MSNFTNNYFDNILKEKLNKNFPKTPCIKSNYNKEEKIPFNNSKSRSGSMIKNKSINKKGNSNSKKKYKINSDLILEHDNHQKNKNILKNFCSKNVLNINNACFNDLSNKNSYYNYNNISGNNFYNKKINYILNYENLNLTKGNSTKINTDSNNFNIINKANSYINNNGVNNYNYNVTTTKNNISKEILSKKNINTNYKNNSKRPSIPKNNNKSKNKNIEDIKNKSKAKQISLLENSKNQKSKNTTNNNYINRSTGQANNNNNHINKTQFNNYNNYNFLNSNHFLKRNFLSNITYTNEIVYNNLIISHKDNSTPISMKYQIPKISKKNMKKKGIKKCQSQSHFNYKKSQKINSYSKSCSSKSGKKNKSRMINHLVISANKKNEGIKNYIKNTNLNINNINKINYNIIKAPFQKKSLINVQYPSEESKVMLYNNNEYANNYNKIQKKHYIIFNFPEEYNNEPLFKIIYDLWEEIGGISPEYKEKFINFTKKFHYKNEIFQNEINDLFLIKSNLKKLNDDIKTRKEIINNLKNFKENKNKNNNEEIKNMLISLRTITIDIINDYISFIKEISYDIIMNKYDINKIKDFNNNYLNELKTDTDFLKNNIYLNKIFSFFKNDPFLISPSLSNSNNNYILLPIDKDMLQKINKCQYFLLKEKIFENICISNNNKNIFSSVKENNSNNIDNDDINNYNYLNSYRHINKEENNISQFNISNNKNNILNSINDYKSFKCNDFCYISNKIREEEDDNNKVNYNNLVMAKKNNIQSENNNTIENISKIMKKVDVEKEQVPNINICDSKDFNGIEANKIDDQDLIVIPYNKDKDPSLPLLYNNYLSSVNDNIIKSFNINSDIFYYSKIGLYPKILLFKDNKSNIKAICTLSFNENLNMIRKILWITSISCTKEYKISQILLNLIDFCKKNEITFDSVEINLYYIKKEDGKFILDEKLEKEIKSEAKFKWVRLENDGEKRKIKYHYIPNSNNIIINKENSILNNDSNINNNDNNKYAIFSSNQVLIKYFEENGHNISMLEHSNIFFILNILKKYYLIDNNYNNNELEIQNILNSFQGIKLKKIIRILSDYNNILVTNTKDFKKDYCSNDNYNIELLYTFLEIIEKNRNKEKNEKDILCLNFNNIYTNFSNIIKIEIDEYEFNLISMNDYIIEVFNINEGEETEDEFNENINIYDNNIYNNENEDKDKDKLYFTKSENENISFIFYEIKDNNKFMNQDDIKLLFNKVLKTIIIKDSREPIKSYKKICLPSFSYKKRNDEDENKNDNTKILNLINYDILDYNESFDFCIENLSNNDIKFSFSLDKNLYENDQVAIIKNNFIVAVINNDLILDHQIPSMSIYYIKKENWVKVQKQ